MKFYVTSCKIEIQGSISLQEKLHPINYRGEMYDCNFKAVFDMAYRTCYA